MVPDEFVNPTIFTASMLADFKAKCDVLNNNLSSSFCRDSAYSLSVAFFNGVKPCDCNSIVSLPGHCNQDGGQCRCRNGVIGQSCDRCAAGYYDLSTTGCTFCDCANPLAHCNEISGQCVCPPNTQGRRCDSCSNSAFGFDNVIGCQICNCDAIGSRTSQCHLQTGQCDCWPHVKGMHCNQCMDGYTNMTYGQGCVECQCDTNGSIDQLCDKITGQCNCKVSRLSTCIF